MKRLINSLLGLVIMISALAVIISVASSAGQRVSEQNETAIILEPQLTADAVLYVKADGTGDCTSWENACKLQTALTNTVSGEEI